MDNEIEFLRTRNQNLTRERNAAQLVALTAREHLLAGHADQALSAINAAYPDEANAKQA